jgi:hypothetical protein
MRLISYKQPQLLTKLGPLNSLPVIHSQHELSAIESFDLRREGVVVALMVTVLQLVEAFHLVGISRERPNREHVAVGGVCDAAGAVEDAGNSFLWPITSGQLHKQINRSNNWDPSKRRRAKTSEPACRASIACRGEERSCPSIQQPKDPTVPRPSVQCRCHLHRIPLRFH